MSWWESCMAKRVSESVRDVGTTSTCLQRSHASPPVPSSTKASTLEQQEPSTHIQNGAYPFTCRDGGNQDSRRVGPGLWEGQHPPLLGSEP